MACTKGRLPGFAAALALTALVGGGCAGASPAPAAKAAPLGPFPCAEAAKVEQTIAPEAQITELTCYFDDYKGHASLHFKVGLKNIGPEPRRFRVNLFLDDGKAVGGLIPDKGSPPVVEPGKEASFVYPVQAVTETPAEITLLVKTIGS